MQIKLSHSESLAMKGLVDKIKGSKLIKVDIGLTTTYIDIDSCVIVDVLKSIKELCKQWEKE